MLDQTPIVVALVAGLIGLLFVAYGAQGVLAKDRGTAKMKEIGTAIQEGAHAFLLAEYRVPIIFTFVVAVVTALGLGWQTAISFM